MDLDRIGVYTSGTCAVHCAITPVILIYAGTLGAFTFLGNPALEWIVLMVAMLVGSASLLPAYRKHRQHHVPGMFAAGVLLVVLSEFTDSIWLAMSCSTLGGSLMALAHFLNLKYKTVRSCR